ncbi:MAG TPA: transposase [Lacipirellulaceae bacterium]|nr:transposase [Lacipirellulaceae bacterium]
MARVEVITGVERRRRWSDDEKRAIVAESFAPGAVVAEVARRADISPGQIYRWRQEVRAAVAGFAPLLIAAPDVVESTAGPQCHGEPAIELEFAGKIIVRIPGSTPAELATAVVKALSRR